MSTITIRNVEDSVKRQIKIIAAHNGRSMEAELHDILKRAANGTLPQRNIAQSIRRKVAKIGGIELDLQSRSPMRGSPDFSEQE